MLVYKNGCTVIDKAVLALTKIRQQIITLAAAAVARSLSIVYMSEMCMRTLSNSRCIYFSKRYKFTQTILYFNRYNKTIIPHIFQSILSCDNVAFNSLYNIEIITGIF